MSYYYLYFPNNLKDITDHIFTIKSTFMNMNL